MGRRLPYTLVHILLICLVILNLMFYLEESEISSLYASGFLAAIAYVSNIFGYRNIIFKCTMIFNAILIGLTIFLFGYREGLIWTIAGALSGVLAALVLSVLAYRLKNNQSYDDTDDDDDEDDE